MSRSVRQPEKPELVGVSQAMREVVSFIDTVAASDCCVLIEGESGTGKELAARRLHAASPRAPKPFIPVNCAGVSESLFESQFFGHVRGAFTGAEQTMLGLIRTAEGGTLLLDEVGEVPLGLQPKLLRALQDGEVMPVGTAKPISVDTRFIAVTNRCLRQMVKEDKFRQDLFYRLNVVRIHLPPLRNRREDIPPLLDHFLALYAHRYKQPVTVVPDPARDQLAEYPWPGNVRELQSWTERLYATGLEPEILATSLLVEAAAVEESAEDAQPDEVMTLEEAEHHAIRRALEATGNNHVRAAHLLDIHRSTLARKLSKAEVA